MKMDRFDDDDESQVVEWARQVGMTPRSRRRSSSDLQLTSLLVDLQNLGVS
jgi:hypothetical protein